MSTTPWTDLSGGIRVRQSRLFWMNSVLLAHPDRSVLVDPGILPSELDDLARVIDSAPTAALTLICTHGDWDHVLGRPWWPGARTLAHDRFANELRAQADHIVEAARHAATDAGEEWKKDFEAFRPDEAVSGLHFTRLGPWRVVLRNAYGHSGSMLSIHLPEQRVLIAGDMLSDIEIPLLNQTCDLYHGTLTELWPLAEHGAIQTLIPGHGSIARGSEAVVARLRRDLAYLDELQRGVVAMVEEGIPIEEAQSRLSAMDFTGKMADYSMLDHHRDNIRVAYEGVSEPSRRGSRSRTG